MKRMKIIFSLMFLLVLLSSCATSIGRMCSSSEKAIPSEIFSDKSVPLLVQLGDDNKVNEKAKMIFNKRFKGKYEILSSHNGSRYNMYNIPELSEGEYADSLKYRYVFRIYIMIERRSGETPSGHTYYYNKKVTRYEILDRKERKIYKPSCWSGSYTGNLKGYIETLNKRLVDK